MKYLSKVVNFFKKRETYLNVKGLFLVINFITKFFFPYINVNR